MAIAKRACFEAGQHKLQPHAWTLSQVSYRVVFCSYSVAGKEGYRRHILSKEATNAGCMSLQQEACQSLIVMLCPCCSCWWANEEGTAFLVLLAADSVR